MNKQKISYTAGLIMGAAFVIIMYAVCLVSLLYLLVFGDNRWLAFMPLTLMFVFSIWRKLHAIYLYIDILSKAQVSSRSSESDALRNIYPSKFYGGPN